MSCSGFRSPQYGACRTHLVYHANHALCALQHRNVAMNTSQRAGGRGALQIDASQATLSAEWRQCHCDYLPIRSFSALSHWGQWKFLPKCPIYCSCNIITWRMFVLTHGMQQKHLSPHFLPQCLLPDYLTYKHSNHNESFRVTVQQKMAWRFGCIYWTPRILFVWTTWPT